MNKESLLEKREAINLAFENQKQLRDGSNAEMLRLQGEYRLIDELINEYKEEEE